MSELTARLERKKLSRGMFEFFKYFLLIVAALIALVPVVVCVFTAFKTVD